MSSRRLQDVFSVTILRLPRHVFKTSSRRICKASSRRVQDVFEDEKLLRWRLADEMSLRHILKTSSKRLARMRECGFPLTHIFPHIKKFWPWMLDARLWTLYPGLWMLDSGLWMLDTVVDCCRTERDPISDFAWLNYWKLFGCESLRTMACSIETIPSDVAILDCFEAAIHSHQFSKNFPGNAGGRVLRLVKLQTDV